MGLFSDRYHSPDDVISALYADERASSIQMPAQVLQNVQRLSNAIFCTKLPLPTEVVVMLGGDVRMEWSKDLAAPDDACVSVYAERYIANVTEDGLPRLKREASEVCELLSTLFAGKFDSTSYDARDPEIARIRSST